MFFCSHDIDTILTISEEGGDAVMHKSGSSVTRVHTWTSIYLIYLYIEIQQIIISLSGLLVKNHFIKIKILSWYQLNYKTIHSIRFSRASFESWPINLYKHSGFYETTFLLLTLCKAGQNGKRKCVKMFAMFFRAWKIYLVLPRKS